MTFWWGYFAGNRTHRTWAQGRSQGKTPSVAEGQKRPHLGLFPGPNVPLHKLLILDCKPAWRTRGTHGQGRPSEQGSLARVLGSCCGGAGPLCAHGVSGDGQEAELALALGVPGALSTRPLLLPACGVTSAGRSPGSAGWLSSSEALQGW